jgi:(p)ppGpp synthase/HD superfamily hydrolase
MTAHSQIDTARSLAYRAHRGQNYGALPYYAHLEDVAAILRPYGDVAVTVGYLHDIVEDTDTTPDELERVFGPFVTRCVLLLTDEPGATRSERKARTYDKLRAVPAGAPEELGLLVKAADRLANVRACLRTHAQKLAMYRSEHQDFRAAAYRPGLAEPLWRELDDACRP